LSFTKELLRAPLQPAVPRVSIVFAVANAVVV